MTTDQTFEAFKQDWWDPEGSFKSLHWINPLRFEYFSSRVKDALGGIEGRRVLDIGCGGGLLSERFAKAGALVTGIDLSPSAIEAAGEHAEGAGLDIDYRVTSVSELPGRGSATGFDCVLCSEMLEHVDDLEGFLKGACSLLGKGGVFLFSTINKTLRARLLAIFLAEDILRLVPHGAHDFERFIKPSRLARLLKQNSIEVEEITGMSFDPLKMDFRLGRNLSVNYLGYGIKV